MHRNFSDGFVSGFISRSFLNLKEFKMARALAFLFFLSKKNGGKK